MKEFQVRTASIIGRDHTFRQANCQDAYAFRESAEHIFGLVSDGCGEGAHSEVGAKLLSKFILEEISLLLAGGVSIKEIPPALFLRCIRFLKRVAWQTVFENLTEFVRDYLLCTVLGFVMDENQGIIFAAGDGLIIINEEIITRDEKNKPNYLGYHLVDRRFLEKADQLPEKFDTYEFDVESLSHLAIATDGFEPELIRDIWNHKHPRGLQRKFNVWSREKHFSDDATMIVVERR
jgi:hypothetical protein